MLRNADGHKTGFETIIEEEPHDAYFSIVTFPRALCHVRFGFAAMSRRLPPKHACSRADPSSVEAARRSPCTGPWEQRKKEKTKPEREWKRQREDGKAGWLAC